MMFRTFAEIDIHYEPAENYSTSSAFLSPDPPGALVSQNSTTPRR
jgi:hypothetical protein